MARGGYQATRGADSAEKATMMKRPASASSAADPLATDGVEASSSGIPTSASRSADPLTPPSKRRRFNMDSGTEGREWLTHDTDADVMFCEWCRRFDRNDHRNQFVKVCQCACMSKLLSVVFCIYPHIIHCNKRITKRMFGH